MVGQSGLITIDQSYEVLEIKKNFRAIKFLPSAQSDWPIVLTRKSKVHPLRGKKWTNFISTK